MQDFDVDFDVMVRSAFSLDLISIENVSEGVAREVYKNCIQHDNFDELKMSIKKAMRSVDRALLRKLVLLIKDRAMSVPENQGRHWSY